MWRAPLRLAAFAVIARHTHGLRSFAKTAGGNKARTKRTSAPSTSVNKPSTMSNQSGGADRTGFGGGAGPKYSSLREKPVPWLLFGVGGFVVYGVGTYSAMIYFGRSDGNSNVSASNVCAGDSVVTEADRRRAYEVGASTYEQDVCSHEAWMGITALRKSLLAKASGKVLEVAAGTGHNFPLYPPVCSVTATDCSKGMVDVARSKGGPVVEGVEQMEVEKLRFRARTFDTVVDTFGLCSYEDPVVALREMARVCKTESDGGR